MIAIIIPTLALSFFGVFNLFGIRQGLFLNQTIYITVGIAGYFAVRKIGNNFFRMNARTLYWVFVGILILTYIIGIEAHGSRRWIDFHFFNFQASEFFKPFFILFFAHLFSKKSRHGDQLGIVLSSILYFLIPTLIIFKQPDLGNALVFTFIYAVMLINSEAPKKYLFYFFGTLLLILPGGWQLLKEYQKERFLSFLRPGVDQQGTAYNMIQSIITIGSGRFFGRGLGLGTQSRLYFLPENHTDFAFASLVEQFGFFGGLLVIILFATLLGMVIRRLFHYSNFEDEQTRFHSLFITGFIAYLFFQVFVNIGMNLGLLPVAGIALPFISYGGSSVVALLIAMALVP